MSTCTGILPNPDISGIGIRVSIYATTLLLAMMPRTPKTEELVNALAANAGLNGLAILITAIVQTAQGQLDFYHAIFILHLLTFLGISASPSTGALNWNTLRLALLTIFSLLTIIMAFAFSFYVWANAPTFGSQPECNDQVQYVIFFFTVRATEIWVRMIYIFGLATACILLLATMIFVPFVRLLQKTIFGTNNDIPTEKYSLIERSAQQVPLGTMGMGGFGGMKNAGIIARVITSVFGIVFLEMTVKANNVEDENVWGFGQILAVVLLFSSLNELLHYVLGRFNKAK